MKTYKELIVWQKSLDLCLMVYQVTSNFPKHELYGLVSQIRRSAVAIPSNTAEGQRRGHKAEFLQFLRIAYGSGAELETQLLIAFKIHYLNEKDFDNVNSLLQEVMKMLNKLMQSLQL